MEIISISNTIIVLIIIIAIVNFLTEITSNMATTAMLLPVMIPLAEIAPNAIHPIEKAQISVCLLNCDDSSEVTLINDYEQRVAQYTTSSYLHEKKK